MPIYEYECRGCKHRFEALVRGSDIPACPSCQSNELERLLSMFAVETDGTRTSSMKTARERNAKITRDKAIADHESAHHHHH